MGDWLTVIIVLLILGILLDGWRRMRNAQRDSLKVSRSMRKSTRLASDDDTDDYRSAELPNGGARVVAYRDSSQDRPRKAAPQPSADDSDYDETREPELGSDEIGYDDADYDESYDREDSDRLEEPEYEQPAPRFQREAPPKPTAAAPETEFEPEPLTEPQQTHDHWEEHREHSSAEPEVDEEPMPTEPDTDPDEDVDSQIEPPTRETPAGETKRADHRSTTGKGRIPEQVALNLDDSVPILMETTDDDEAHEASADGRIEPTFGGGAQAAPDSVDPAERDERPRSRTETRAASTPSFSSTLGSSIGQKAKQAKAALSAKLAEKAAQFNHTDSAPEATEEPAAPAREASPPKAKPAPRKAAPKAAPSAPPEPEEVLVINVMAPKGKQFLGEPLLDALMRAGLRYGDMNIFHRYEEERGGGAILFSLANMVKPGIFDLNAMDDFHTPGVSLFMTLPLEDASLENIDVFELMLDSARSLVNDLGGELKDENRSVMTRQTMEHCRQRIHEFDRKQLYRAPH